LLGQGGFGVVYGATRVRDGLRVAVKVALPGQRAGADRLEREAIALERVGPPHAPVVHVRGAMGDQYGVVLEYLDAPTLADRLVDEAGPMPIDRFAACAAALLRAVGAIHARGVVHRDLKPENIFLFGLAGETVATIIDFGLAKEASAPTGALERTDEDAMGTAEYMSPEQCEGRADVDGRSDLYSVGALFYEMLAGVPPFWGPAADVREAQRSRRPPPLPARIGCSPNLEDVVRRCLAKDRARRFGDVGALASAFDEAVAVALPARKDSMRASIPAPAPPPPTPAVREKRTMGLLFFEARGPLAQVQPALIQSGGQLVQMSGSQCIAAFGHDVGDNPARTAIVAGSRLLAAGLCDRLLVDVAAVSVQARPDGSTRIFSAVFSKKDRFPLATDPAGVTLTAGAVDVVPGLSVLPVPDRPGRFRLDLGSGGREESTKYGTQGGPTLGRDPLLTQLLASAREALARSEPTLATVVGEAGHGKTHLAGALALRLEREVQGCEIITLTAQESALGGLSETLPDLLRRLVDGPAAPPEDGGRAFWTDRLGATLGGQAWAGASFVLGWIPADHPEVRRLAAAPGALRLATSRATGEALRRRAAGRPIALLLDDAHFADDATLDALEYATLREGGARIWALAFVRPTFQKGRPMWATRAARAPAMTLGPLEASDAADLARVLLQVEHVPAVALAKLAERTQGVPRLLVELIRGLKRDGLVRRRERGTGYYLATDELDKLPDLPLVQWNARREVETLPAQLAGHARLASVLGARFTAGDVEALILILEKHETMEDVQLDASVGIQRLIDARLLVRHRTGLVDFRNSLMRDTIYQLLPDERRRSFHRAAFEMYRAKANLSVEERLPRLALHAARSGLREEAAAAYLEFAERAAQTHAYLEAELAFAGALENLSADDPSRTRAARGRGLMRFRLGRHDDALKDLTQALEQARVRRSVEDEIDLALDTATVLDWTRDFAQSAELVRRAQSLSEAPSALAAARIKMGLARTHFRRSEPEACVRVGAEAAAMAEALGGPGYETMVIALMMAGAAGANIGQLDEAERVFDKILAAAESRGDMQHVAGVLNNRAFLWFARKDADKLFAELAAATRIAREICAPLLEYSALQGTGEVAYVVESLERATEHAQRASELATQLWGAQSGELSARELLLARVALYRDDLGEARRLVDRIVARSSSGAEGAALLPSDQILLAMVDLGSRDAAAAAEEWDALLERASGAGLQPLEELELLEAIALATARAGRLDEAKARLRRALDASIARPNLMSNRIERKYAAMFGPG
jgi:tetratricopeptide (TPR) repeat protein